MARPSTWTQKESDMTQDLDAAQAVIQSAADALTAQLRAKGYEKAHAEIWIGRELLESCHIFIDGAPGVAFVRPSKRLNHAIAAAEKAIAAAPQQYATPARA